MQVELQYPTIKMLQEREDDIKMQILNTCRDGTYILNKLTKELQASDIQTDKSYGFLHMIKELK